MAQRNTPRKFYCDCAADFEGALSLGEHIKQTGHMKTRWCELCSQLFSKKQGLEQHKKTAAKHKVGSAVPSKPNVTHNKLQENKPNDASSKPATPTKVARTPENVKGKKKAVKSPTKAISNGSQAIQTPLVVASASSQAALTSLPDSLAMKYPWASKQESPKLLVNLKPHCHDQNCLLAHGYYTGGLSRPEYLKSIVHKFVPTPAMVKGVMKRKAIALDCEMVGLSGGRDELARLCAIDLFTGEVLVDTLVFPTEAVRDWRSRFSGVTMAMMREARNTGKALNGWPAARAKLFELADAETILVGHALNHDLKVLYVSHKRVVDSSLLVSEAVFGKGSALLRIWGLKTLSRELLGLTIQSSRKGHDCLEDTLATRELVLWCLKEREQLKVWAENALIQFETEKRKRQERQQEQARERQRQMLLQEASSPASPPSIEPEDDVGEYFYDSDLFPPGYEPYSD